MIFGLLYDIFLHLYIIASLPKIFRNWSKYKNIFWQRLGGNFPSIDKKGKKLIWIHAVSLGETKAVAPLIKKFKALPDAPQIVLSTTTATGRAEGLRNAPEADFHLFLPLDISYLICPIIRRVSPDTIILTETDFWYHFQQAAKRQGAQLYVINGKISERTFRRLSRVPFVARRLLHPIDHFYLQGEIYRRRFRRLKIPTSKLTITGNIKLDTQVERCDEEALRQKLGLKDEPVLTLGSTHSPEESLWIVALKQLWKDFPNLKVLIVPRHPERFTEVAKLLETEHVPFSYWSQGGRLSSNPVLLVDAMGILRNCYQISTLTFVGGSLTPKVGGHNILEPAFYGKSILFGPYMYSQPDLLDLVNTYHSGIQIDSNSIVSTVKNLLTNPTLNAELGSNGLALTRAARGSLDTTFNLLQKRLA